MTGQGWTPGLPNRPAVHPLSRLRGRIDPHQQAPSVVSYSLQLPAFYLLTQGVWRGAEQTRSIGERHAYGFGHGWTGWTLARLDRLDKVDVILA